jgi:hypothetical protein
MTIREPADPTASPRSIRDAASVAAARSGAITTPLPAHRPSAFTTIGYEASLDSR